MATNGTSNGLVYVRNAVGGNQEYWSWGGEESWGFCALQSFQDSGQNVDAKAITSDTPRVDPVRTRGWRNGYQRELTWTKIPVTVVPGRP
jgi:hypothetical protein